ncbi:MULTISPECIES: hypothetical protein [unclassified Rhodococcus (in: high G+C Gram-positive bacteria)]|uniref:hypothetical protein n=1 Tax=unclassified Rhodococcus (in: high G+C Gram-positive bacteria) TaxID=192944 RepID=UPI0027DF068E|nr:MULTISPECIES: hypothetical protein [unclassified Rhodococcus (in: high G+C Gram-positive bacteria)]
MKRAPLESGPDEMRRRWALCSALTAAQGRPDHCCARDRTWHYDDGGGNWADVRILDEGRAVLVGHDHEYSDTYYAGAAPYFGEPETDLLADTPAWWRDAIEDYLADIERNGMWIGFVYGFDGGVWTRADYTVSDGFESLDLPTVTHDATARHLTEFLQHIARDQGMSADVDPQAVAAAIAAGADVSADQLRSLFGARQLDVAAGVEAARAFR